MDVKTLVRDPAKVKSVLKQTGTYVTSTKPCKLIVPCTFQEGGMVSIGLETYTIGIFALVVEDTYYATSIVPSMMRIEPDRTSYEYINDVKHFVFEFNPGSKIFANTNLVQQLLLIYNVFNEIVSRGRVPWHMTYDDLGSIFDNVKEFTGSNIGSEHDAVELLISLVARSPTDPKLQYRQYLAALAPNTKNIEPPYFAPLESVDLTVSNNLSKLTGSYFGIGVASVLVSPSTKVGRIEEQLRR